MLFQVDKLSARIRRRSSRRETKTTGIFSDSVLNVRKHILSAQHRKSSRNFSSIVNKWSSVIGCKYSMIRHCVIWELSDIVPLNQDYEELRPLRRDFVANILFIIIIIIIR